MSMTNRRRLEQRFPNRKRNSAGTPPGVADPPAHVPGRRRALESLGRQCKTVLSPVCARHARRHGAAARDRQLPGDGRGAERCRARRRRGRLRQRPRPMADDDGGRAHRLHAGLRQADGRPAATHRQPDHVGDRQEPGRFGEGVRPHSRVHPGDDRCAEGSRQRQLALPDRRRHDRPDPPHAARRRAVHGPVQLPAQRDLRHADPGAADGQHRCVQAAAVRHLAVLPAARGVPQRLSRRGDQHRLRAGRGGRAAHARLRQGERAGADRIEQGRRPPEEAAPEVASPARHSRAGRQERRDRAARCGHRADRQGVPAGHAVVQRPTLHRPQDADRPPLDRRARSCGASPRSSPS